MVQLTEKRMRESLQELDRVLPRAVTLIVGGGGAMLLAYAFPLTTSDIDAIPRGLSSDELKPYVEQVARVLGLPPDWLNTWYGSFTNVLPEDYSSRLVEVFSGKHLKALALGKEDLLVMKCFAHRAKDIAHARALFRAGAKTDLVYERIEELEQRKFPGTTAARDFLEQVIELEDT